MEQLVKSINNSLYKDRIKCYNVTIENAFTEYFYKIELITNNNKQIVIIFDSKCSDCKINLCNNFLYSEEIYKAIRKNIKIITNYLLTFEF